MGDVICGGCKNVWVFCKCNRDLEKERGILEGDNTIGDNFLVQPTINGKQYPLDTKQLDLDNTQVSDLSPLAGLTRLKWLYLRNTQVSDLSPLAGLTKLKDLWLYNTQVSKEQIEAFKQKHPNCEVYHD